MDIIYVFLLLFSFAGYFIYLKYKFNIVDELNFGFQFIFITFVTFVFGLLNILVLGSYVLLILGICLLIYSIKKYKSEISTDIKHPNINLAIILILFIYVTVVSLNFKLVHYDNFTHWGLIVKNMILFDRLPNFENLSIIFKGYQPGSACFIYYIAHFFDFNEGIMITCQNYLLVAFFSSILLLTHKRNPILKVLSVFTIIFSMIISVPFCNLLVDTLLSSIFTFVFVLVYYYQKDLKKLFICLFVVSIYLCLIKNTGYVLTFIICLIFLLISIKNKEFKKGIIGSFIIGISSLLLLYIWTAHVKYSYGYYALYSHHAFTTNNILVHLKELGIDGIVKFIKIYLTKFADIENNRGVLLIFLANIILLCQIIFSKNRKKIFKYLVIIDFIYIVYYIFLGLMYICSMEQDGLFVVVAFNRYILTITVPLFILSTLVFFHYSSNYKSVLVYIFSIVYIATILCVTNASYSFDSLKFLVGNLDYENTYAYELDKIVGKKYINENSNQQYYVYAPNSKNSYGLLMYSVNYKFNVPNVRVVFSIDDFSTLNINGSRIIRFEQDKEIDNYLKNISYCEISKNIYEECKEG